MQHLHWREILSQGDEFVVTLGSQANVMIMTDHDYSNYNGGRQFNYYGGRAVRSPIHLTAPRAGAWNLVIDLGGGSGSIRHNVQVVRH